MLLPLSQMVLLAFMVLEDTAISPLDAARMKTCKRQAPPPSSQSPSRNRKPATMPAPHSRRIKVPAVPAFVMWQPPLDKTVNGCSMDPLPEKSKEAVDATKFGKATKLQLKDDEDPWKKATDKACLHLKAYTMAWLAGTRTYHLDTCEPQAEHWVGEPAEYTLSVVTAHFTSANDLNICCVTAVRLIPSAADPEYAHCAWTRCYPTTRRAFKEEGKTFCHEPDADYKEIENVVFRKCLTPRG